MDVDEEGLDTLSLSDLRKRCVALGVSTTTLLEKTEYVAAIRAAEAAEAEAIEAAAIEAAEREAAVAAADAEAEEEAMRQALLMSEESVESLQALGVGELRRRAALRGVKTTGIVDKADLIQTLLGDVTVESAPSSSSLQRTQVVNVPGVEVLAAFSEHFWCQAVSNEDDGASLDPTAGKVLLPHSCLMAIAAVLGGDLPTTLLLRLSHMDSTVYVGVADFVSDSVARGWLRRREELPVMRPPTWGPANALAAVFVPRWVRGSLSCGDGAHVQVALVSMPKATGLVLQPQTESFAMAVTALGDDPRAILTPLLNRYVCVAKGDLIHFELMGSRFAVEILAVRGLPAVRCGRPDTLAIQCLDVGAALATLQPVPQLVPAACLHDADVEVDFAPSAESEGVALRAREAAVEVEAERQRLAALTAQQAVAASDPWDATRVGKGHVLGGADAQTQHGRTEKMNEREKKLAALQRRGL